METEREAAKKVPKEKPRSVAFFVSLSLLLFLLIVYILRPDALTALHWWPFSYWTPFVLLPFLPRFWKHGKGPLLIVAILIGGMLVFDGAWRWALSSEPQSGYRVVSLNCEAGNTEAIREGLRTQADLVLLQEVPTDEEVIAEGIAAGYPYALVGLDTAILSRHPFRETIHEQDFVSGETRVGDRPIKVVSLRLLPPVFRLDLYNPAAWTAYSQDAQRRRIRIDEILAKSRPDLIGGDFNATSPTLFRGKEYQESSRSAGKGWPGTGTNDYPFARVDQIWCRSSLEFRQSFVRKTANSDHRMVFADFEFAK